MNARPRCIAAGAVAAALVAASACADAAPIEWRFTGTVRDDRDEPWRNLPVSGSVFFNVEAPGYQEFAGQGPGQFVDSYSAGNSFDDSPWLSYRLVNPDGSVTVSEPQLPGWVHRFDIWRSEVPTPGWSRLLVEVGYDEGGGFPPEDRYFYLIVSGQIDTTTGRTPSDFGVNLDTATFTEGYSYVRHDGRMTIDYGFTLNSFERVPAVPEPQTWAMLGGGLALLGWLRRRAGSPRAAAHTR